MFMNYTTKKKSTNRKNKRGKFITRVIMILIIIVAAGIVINKSSNKNETVETYKTKERKQVMVDDAAKIVSDIDIDIQYLTPNDYSRPQTKLTEINAIVIHYTANPGTTAQNNHDYFEGLSISGETYASSHFVIGIDGEIIQCIPLNEICYASNNRNSDTIAIECCHPDATGEFSDDTYESLVELVAKLQIYYQLDDDEIIRHYDITGKMCPKYYVENEDAWDKLLEDIKTCKKRYLLENNFAE